MKKKSSKNKKHWITIILVIVVIILLSISVYAFIIYNNVKNTVNNNTFYPVESINLEKTKEKLMKSKPLNILLLGIDTTKSDGNPSDALMVLSLDSEEETMQLISIPRDTKTTIVGRAEEDKINAAYTFGGVEMTLDTVKNFLNIEMDYYVRMNMAGLEELINELGGITVDNDIAWNKGGYNFKEGLNELDGNAVSYFVLDRKQDPNRDFGRTKRQRKVIRGIINEGVSIESITKINGIIDILGNNMATNIDFNDVKELISKYKNTRNNFISYYIEGNRKNFDGESQLAVPDAEIEKVREMITK